MLELFCMKKPSINLSLDSLIPISALNKGKAESIIAEMDEDDVQLIIKNNEPMAAILSISRLNQLLMAEQKLKEEVCHG